MKLLKSLRILYLLTKPLLRSRAFLFWTIVFTAALVIFYGVAVGKGVGEDLERMFPNIPDLQHIKEVSVQTAVYSTVAFGMFISLASGSITQTYELAYGFSTLFPFWIRFTKLTATDISLIYLVREFLVGFMQIFVILLVSLVAFSAFGLPAPHVGFDNIYYILIGLLLTKLLFVTLRFALVSVLTKRGGTSNISFISMAINFLVGFVPLGMFMGTLSPSISPYIPPLLAVNLFTWGLVSVNEFTAMPLQVIERMRINYDVGALVSWGILWQIVLGLATVLSLILYVRISTREIPTLEAIMKREMW